MGSKKKNGNCTQKKAGSKKDNEDPGWDQEKEGEKKSKRNKPLPGGRKLKKKRHKLP